MTDPGTNNVVSHRGAGGPLAPRFQLRFRVPRILLGVVAMAAALGVPVLVQAREVTLTFEMTNKFGRVGAYAIFYITDEERGDYQGTLWAYGNTSRYYGQFRHWWRATQPISKIRHDEYDGITGASLTRGEEVTLSVEIADELFDAGYVIRVDTSVQDGRDVPSEAVLPLTTEAAGVSVEGRHYIQSLKFDM